MPSPPPAPAGARTLPRTPRPVPSGAQAWILRGAATEGRAVHGRSDVPPRSSSASDRANAAAIAAALVDLGARRVHGSPLQRCRSSADALATALEVPLEVVPALCAQDRGQWQDVAVEDYEARWHARADDYWSDPLHFAPPSGETEGELEQRAVDALLAACAVSEGGPAVLVTHACVQRALVGAALGLAPGIAHRLECAHGHGILLAAGAAGWTLAALDVPPQHVRLADGR